MSVIWKNGFRISFQTLSPPIFTTLFQQTRNTFIVKRRTIPLLHKKGERPKRLKGRHYVYDLVEDTEHTRQDDIKLILLQHVDGVGLKGDVVSVRPKFGRHQLLVPGLAVYASPENLTKYQGEQSRSESEQHSSVYAGLTANYISRAVIPMLMNLEHPWTIEKWHVRTAIRRCGIYVPEYAIKMPEKPISGPDLDLENKMFLVTVKINNCEEAVVRCRIHHWTSDLRKQLPSLPNYFAVPAEPVFPEDAEIIAALPATPRPKAESAV